MRLRRSRRRNLILLSTRDVRPYGPRPAGVIARRRRFRLVRTGALLTAIGLVRLAQIARRHWRLSLGLAGVLLEVVGHSVLTGQARDAVGLTGLIVVLVAILKSEDPAHSPVRAISQTAWRWHG